MTHEATAGGGPDSLYVVEQVPTRPSAPRVVLVHGTMDRSTSFAKVARRLDDLDVVRYDRRGYGRSREAGVGGLATQIDDLLAVIGDRPAVLAGHSFGGTLSLAAALLRPDLVPSVFVYEAPVPRAWRAGEDQTTEAPLDDPSPLALDRGIPLDPAGQAERFMRRMIGDRRWERLPTRTRADRRAEGPALLADGRSMRTPDVVVDLADVAVPVVVAWGSATSARHLAGAQRLLATLADAEPAVIEGADHGAHLTHPGPFADLVRRAVGRAGGRAAGR
ncbi:MAG TPA: alpha/beta hydrolase [Acidimicrobiales bacterium]|nr:alpha/beta hydrolase [Acidimicrobiales bacterium]